MSELEVHPYRTAWRERDPDAWGQALAPGVVIHSPILREPFRGREQAVELFGVLFDALGEVEITDEFTDGDTHVFFWRVRIGARTVEGLDKIRHDQTGTINEITVMIRPLVDIATFAAAIGPGLAAKRGRLRGPLVWFLNAPLRSVFALIDAIASRLTQRA